MGTTQLNIIAVLESALAMVRKGWTQEGAGMNAHSIDTALEEAIEDSPWIGSEEPVFPPEPPLTEAEVMRKEGRRLTAVYDAVWSSLAAGNETVDGGRIEDVSALAKWNDAKGRNKSQVIAVLRNAAVLVPEDLCLCEECAIAEEEPVPAVAAAPHELPGCGDKCDISELCGCSEFESNCAPATAPFPPGYASNAVECECSACRAEIAHYE